MLSNFKFSYLAPLLSVFAISFLGCTPRNNYTTTGAVAGTVVGGGAGAAIGSASGNTGTGAAVGAAVGALSGAAIGDVRDDAEDATKQQDAFIKRQELERQKQERELQDLRRQKYHDDYFKSRYPNAADKDN
jgi:outer membrane lipoprotein SlyB